MENAKHTENNVLTEGKTLQFIYSNLHVKLFTFLQTNMCPDLTCCVQVAYSSVLRIWYGLDL